MSFCGRCGARLPNGAPARGREGDRRAAQRRHMTAMFCDVVGSTPLAESLDPEELGEVLSGYQDACVRAIDRWGGYTARFVGDGVVAYFGFPIAHEDDAQRAVHAGLGILDELAGLNEQLRDWLGISLQVRIGLHTGTVVAGEITMGDSPGQLDIVGEMPHIAARLESIAPPGSVVISSVTGALVDGYFELESLGEKVLKGVSRPVGVHRVLRATGAVGRLEVAGGRPLTPLVGRDRELQRLADAWQSAEEGRGGVVDIRGEAGIGKSRLVRALTEHLGERVGGIVTWQCSALHQATSLYPVMRSLEHVLGLDRVPAPEARLTALDRTVRLAGLDQAEAVPLLADLLSLDRRRDPGEPELTPRDARSSTLRILEALLVADPARQPLLLVVEDLHWADPTTIELLERITANLPARSALCVVTFRPELEPPWAGRRSVLDIRLGPLSSEHVREMLLAAGESAVDPAVAEWVDSAADGVPLFVEEMVKMLSLERGTGSPAAVAPGVPPTLEGLLTERLDRLPDLGDVIDCASVLGREFERDVLGALQPLGDAELAPALALLAAQGILRPVAGTRSRLEFTHALVQEAAYERLLRRRRRALHGQVAATLSVSFADVAEREPEIIAHHWTYAAEPAKAATYWHAAGTRALERAAFQEAAEHFRRGVEALDQAGVDADDLQRADFLAHRAASLQAGYGYAAAGVDDAYAEARPAYERAGHDDGVVSVIRGQWMFYLLRGEYASALELADEMRGRGERAGDPVRLAEGHLYRGLAHMYLGDFGPARLHLDSAFARYRRPEHEDQIYDAQGDTGVGALAYNALVLWNLGHVREATERSDRSLELAEQVGGQVTRAQAWGMRAILHLTRAEPAEFGHWVEQTRAHCVEHSVGYWRILATLFEGWLLGRSGQLDAGSRQLEESLDAYTRAGSTLSLPHFHILLADLRLVAGDRAGALDLLRVGEEYIEASGERFSESELQRFKGRVLMTGSTPEPDAATEAYHRAVEVAREQEAKLLELRAATHLVTHERRIGSGNGSIAELAAVCDWFTDEAADLPDVSRARALLSEP
jgi:class 3 adenylate cyclase/tetratricopeptide (TPR) repeat protein